MKIASWNVNSLNVRLPHLEQWLREAAPDVVSLQETKLEDLRFPDDVLAGHGYRSVFSGQKTYNGVAILSREEPEDVERGLPGIGDPQARLLSAQISGVRVISAYFPNGEQVGTEKYAYKLAWMARLREYLESRYVPSQPLVLCGDFNVARDERDVARPAQWAESVLFHETARDALEQIRLWGLIDVVRKHHPEGGIYSWWDYRMLGFPKNNGLRIDHIFATEPLAHRSTSAEIDREERKGEKPSDHAPVIAVFADA